MEETVVEQLALRQAIDRLPERERTVVILRYYLGRTQQQCAQRIGVSQVQVSRLEKRAVDRLRQLLTE
jgi:RNA polymerase sporulation-specific sigma factor